MTGALRGRQFHRDVATRPLRGGVQNRASQRSRASANLHDTEVIGLSEPIEFGINPACEHGTEQRPDFWRGDEISAATGTTGNRVEALLAVQRLVEILVEAQQLVQGAIPARSVMAPTLAIRPGSTPNTRVDAAQITNAAFTEPCTLMGVTSPSGAGFIHISRMMLM